ncbi:hypothetical protein [Jannaschia sp. LMIT008]|uniref:hypothetical protein n=1 Tax=Jannaschia maritima TaxID=3032585 RepID=UPI0028112461|nr:hypothetical protein [Jannaschia sp. LMIT008]
MGFTITNAQRQVVRDRLDERDRQKLVDYLTTLPFFAGTDRDRLDASVARAFDRRKALNVRTPNGLAWLVLLTHLGDTHPAFARTLTRIDELRHWSFDQIARMLAIGDRR